MRARYNKGLALNKSPEIAILLPLKDAAEGLIGFGIRGFLKGSISCISFLC